MANYRSTSHSTAVVLTNNMFCPLDERDLQWQRLLTHPNSTGWRKLHRQQLGRYARDVFANLPRGVPSCSEDGYMKIPTEFMSEATIEYLGFHRYRAADLWRAWIDNGSFGDEEDSDSLVHTGFMAFITRDFATWNGNDRDWDDQAWIDFMTRCGLDRWMQSAIMDPVIKPRRLSASCSEFCERKVWRRYKCLVSLRYQSLKREEALRAHKEALRARKEALRARGEDLYHS